MTTDSQCPPDRKAAHVELRALGRTLGLQVADRTGAGECEVDAVLRRMKQLHAEIVIGLQHDA